MVANYQILVVGILINLFCRAIPIVNAGVRTFDYSKDIMEIASPEPGQIIVCTKDREVFWLNVTPSGLQRTSSVQLEPIDSVKRIWGNQAFSVLWLARNQNAFNQPQPAKQLLKTFEAGSGDFLHEQVLNDSMLLSSVVFSKHPITHESIVEIWKLTRGKEAWHLHAVDGRVKYLDNNVAIYDDVALTDNVREIKVMEFETGRTIRFFIPNTARLVAATTQRGEWRFYVNDGGWLKLYSKGVPQPTVRQINNFRRARPFPGGCIVETELDIIIFPWTAESKPWVLRKREGLEWTFGGNERYGVAAIIGRRGVLQFDWKTDEKGEK